MAGRSHLSIGEVLSLLQDEFPDVTISKIRFLESQGLLDPERTPSGYRKFYEGDVRRLRWILTEQRDNFLPLKVIKDRLEEGMPGELAGRDNSGNGAAAAVPRTPSSAGDPAPTEPPTAEQPAAAPEAGTRGPSDQTGAPSRVDPAQLIEGPARPEAVPEVPAEETALPIWMADAARAKAGRGGGAAALDLDEGPEPFEVQVGTVSLSADELAAASGLKGHQLDSLLEYGLLSGHTVGDARFFDGDDLVVAQSSAGFLGRGVEARHLRMFKTAAEREAALLEQLTLPLVKQRQGEARQEARDTVAELARLGQSLRAAFLRSALSEHLG